MLSLKNLHAGGKALFSASTLFLLIVFFHFDTYSQERRSGIDSAEFKRIEFRHKANYDFYRRVLSFSRLSWASPIYLDQGSKKDYYILSADVSPHFNIGGERMPVVFQLTPRYMVRIFRNNETFGDSSLAVRTPSYMPGATLYFPFKKVKRIGEYNWYKDLHYLSAAFFHHSNGQDGAEFVNGEINEQNGNFSTNYFEFAFNFNFRDAQKGADFGRVCDPESDCRQNAMPYGYRDWYGKFGVEQHFSTTDEIKDQYGTTRINFNLGFVRTYNARLIVYRNEKGKTKTGSQIDRDTTQMMDLVDKVVNSEEKDRSCEVIGKCFQKEYIRFLMNTSFIVNKLSERSSLSHRVNIDLGMYMRIAGSNTAWFVMVGYYGSDPYNIYFQDSYFFARTGVALGFFNRSNKFDYD